MNAIKIGRGILAISFIFSLAAAYQPDGSTWLLPAHSFAQDASKSRPGNKIENSATASERDREGPKGRTEISVEKDLVSLQVLVSDTKGNVLTGLRRENFTIYEDNVKQQISHFSSVDSDITVVLLVEYSNNISYFIGQILDSMSAFIDSLQKEDWVAVVGYDLHPAILCDFTQDRQKIYSTLNRFRFPNFDESCLSDALIDTLDRVQEIEGKVAILLIGTGLDIFSKHSYDDALKKCKESNASVYAIGLGQRYRIMADMKGLLSNIQRVDLEMGDQRLKSFAEYSGGQAFFPYFETELPEIMGKISKSLRSRYSIAYSPTNTRKDGKFRKVKVNVDADIKDDKGKKIKFKVVARKGYIPD
jgi:VWFA-related protein